MIMLCHFVSIVIMTYHINFSLGSGDEDERTIMEQLKWKLNYVIIPYNTLPALAIIMGKLQNHKDTLCIIPYRGIASCMIYPSIISNL